MMHAELTPGLHGDTRICTAEGHIAIEKLVGTQGKVLTLGQLVADYDKVRLAQHKVGLLLLLFDDWSQVACTPATYFLTDYGWIAAQELAGYNCCSVISDNPQGPSGPKQQLYPSGSYRGEAQGAILRDPYCLSVEETLEDTRKMLRLCINLQAIGARDVYWMEVAETNAFALANGVVVGTHRS